VAVDTPVAQRLIIAATSLVECQAVVGVFLHHPTVESHPITRVMVAVHNHHTVDHTVDHTVEAVTATTRTIILMTIIITTITITIIIIIEDHRPLLRGTLAATDLFPTIVMEAFLPEDGNGIEEGVLRLGGITIDVNVTGITILPLITAIILLRIHIHIHIHINEIEI